MHRHAGVVVACFGRLRWDISVINDLGFECALVLNECLLVNSPTFDFIVWLTAESSLNLKL